MCNRKKSTVTMASKDKEALVQGSIMAFDFGLARIGVATANMETRLAMPLLTLPAVAGEPQWDVVHRLINEWQPVMFVIGEPTDTDETLMKGMLKKFARKLQEKYQAKLVFHDEVASSISARASIREQARSGFRKRVNKPDIDKIAAAIILQDLLDSNVLASPS